MNDLWLAEVAVVLLAILWMVGALGVAFVVSSVLP